MSSQDFNWNINELHSMGITQAYLKNPRPNTNHKFSHTSRPHQSSEKDLSFDKLQKISLVRHQAARTKQNVKLLQARLNALKKQKQKNAKEAEWAKEKVDHIRSIKSRCQEEANQRKEVQSRKQVENIYLKRRVSQLKYNHQKEKEQVMTALKNQRHEISQSIKRQSQLNDEYLEKFKQVIKERNKLKAIEVKAQQRTLELKQNYKTEKKIFARKNRLNKLQFEFRKRSQTYDMLKKLTAEEEKIIEQLKMSETSKIVQFKTLEEMLNPEAKVNSVYKKIFSRVFRPEAANISQAYSLNSPK